METQKASEFRTQGQGDTNFTRDFVDAVNTATREISRRCDLETRIAMIDSPADTIALSDEYTDVVSAMVSVNLIDKGQRPARGQEEQYEVLRRRIPRLVDQIRCDILNQAMASDTTDSVDFVGLGALG